MPVRGLSSLQQTRFTQLKFGGISHVISIEAPLWSSLSSNGSRSCFPVHLCHDRCRARSAPAEMGDLRGILLLLSESHGERATAGRTAAVIQRGGIESLGNRR